jgi:NADPH:quinone reductase-like Zn-dependent oxidoreductase
MKAAQINRYGGKDSVSVNKDATKPTIAAGEILVEVYAASVNPFDWKLREGSYQGGIKLSFPAILGGDVSGVIAEIGEDVTGFEVGQAVYGMANAAGGQGSFAEFTPVSAKQLASRPKNVDYITVAALPLTASAAYQAIIENINIQAGQKILIHGGAGGIGSLAIQLAREQGAYVTTTAAANDNEFVKSLGADEVIDYKTQDFSEILKKYDAVFDTVGGETNQKSYKILKPGGVLVSMLEQPDEAKVKEHGIRYVQQSTIATSERLTEIATLVEAGKLKVTIDEVFPLDQAAEALEYLKTNHTRGKVILQLKQQAV